MAPISQDVSASVPAPAVIRQVEKISAIVERRPRIAITAIFALYLACSLLTAATKLLWFDELHVLHIAHLPAVSDVIGFYAAGLDVHTPVVALIERGSTGLLGNNFVGLRAPFILGYLLFILCLHQFASRWAGPLWGLAAMTFPLVCPGIRYATEIRPYALVLGFSALAALCWQRAGQPRRRTSIALLWFSLTFCVALHYYAVFLAVPFALAEFARWRQLRRPHWSVAAAIATPPLVIVLFLPAMQKARAIYAPHIWAKPHWWGLGKSYDFLLSDAYGVIVSALFLCLLIAVVPRRSASVTRAMRTAVPLSERILCGTIALFPMIVVPASFLTGVFHERYTLPALTGITLSLILLAWRVCRGNRLTAVLAATVFLGGFVLQTAMALRNNYGANAGYPLRTAYPYTARPWMRLIAASDLPVVVTPGLFFLPFQYYVPAAVQSRTYYLASQPYALRFEQTDSVDAVLIHMAKAVPGIQVSSYDDFISRRPKFLLLADVTGPAWIISKLTADGAQLQLLLRYNGQMLFAVTAP